MQDFLSEIASRAPVQRFPENSLVFALTQTPSGRRTLENALDRSGFVVSHYIDEAAFVSADHPGRRGCVVIDTTDEIGLSLLQRIRPFSDRIKPILVSDHADIRFAVTAAKAGAFDVLRKPLDQNRLQSSIREALGSLSSFPDNADPDERGAAPENAKAGLAHLTRRQIEILTRIVQGQPNKIIAADLGISLRTAENHRAAVMRKFGVSSISALIQVALGRRQTASEPTAAAVLAN